MSDFSSNVLVIGVGNEFRCDDAIGIVLLRRIREKIGDRVRFAEHDGDGASLIEELETARKVILIDAVAFGSPPGTVHFVDAVMTEIPKETKHHSSHLFSVAEAIETARILKKLPPVLHIYGIEGRSFEMGTNISEEVMNSADEVIDKILLDLTT